MAEQLNLALAPKRGPQIAVLPDAARAEERLLGLARERGFVAGKVAWTLAQLERELVREAQRAGTCPEVASPQALQLALREAARSHSAGPYSALRNQAGYAAALGEVLAALTDGALSPAQLLELDVPERPRALARTLLAARQRLARAGLVDAHEAVRLGAEHLAGGGTLPQALAGAALLEFDGILDWTPLRLRLLAALAGRMRVRIRLPWPAGRPELTEALEPALRAIEKLPEPAPELELFDPEEPAPLLALWLRGLFAPEASPAHAPVELVSCASPAAQAQEVARRCAALLRSGARPDSIAVAARSLADGQAEDLGAALLRAGVPFRERRGEPALQAPPVRLSLSLLELLEDDLPRERLIDLLCSRLLRLEEDADRLPPQALARTLREAHAVDDAGGGGYARALAELAGRLEGNAGEDADAAARARREGAVLEETRRRVLRVIAALRSLPAQGSLAEHGAALLSLLGRWGLWSRLRAPQPEEAGAMLERASLAALARDQAAGRALEQACAGLARAEAKVGEVRVPRAEFTRILSQALSQASLPASGARGGTVQLVELRELAGRSVDHLFLVGLVDGELPARPSPDPLLSDEERHAVNRAAGRAVFRAAAEAGDPGLLPPRQAQEPLLFHAGLCAARRSLTLLWPRTDAQGREILRSTFADEAARASAAAVQVLPLSTIPQPARCADGSSLLSRAALDAFAEPAYRVTPPAPAQEARALAAALLHSPLAARFRRVARAAAAERERVRAFVGEIAPGRFSGQLTGAALQLSAQAFAFGPDAPASSGQLEDHATCGFRTLGKRLLRIDPDERDDAELGSRERGSLLHLCLERFFRRLLAEGRLPLRGTAEEIATLREVAAAAMDEFARREHVGNPSLWELKREELLENLVAVVESEKGAQPLELERKFGFQEPGSWPPLRLGDVHVRGVIDRIDRLPDGTLLVLDYKSGRVDSLAPRLKPEALLAPRFQLALYAEAVRQREPGARVDAGYLSLRDAEHTRTLRESGIDPDALPLAHGVAERVEKMRAGLFAVRPLNCDYCELKPACRLVALPTDPDENGGEAPRG